MNVHPHQVAMQKSKKVLGVVPFVAGQRQELAVQNGLPKDYYYRGLFLSLSGRYTSGTTDGTFNEEAFQNLLEMIEISGNHKVLGDYTPYRLQGDHCYTLGNVEDGYTHKRLVSVNGANLSSAPVVGSAPLAAATYDFKVNFHINFPPRRINVSEEYFYMLDAPYWNTLQLYISWGGIGSFVSGYGGNPTLTAFGANTGTPQLIVTREIAKLSAAKNTIKSIPVKRSYKSVPIVNSQNASYISDLNKGNLIRSFWLKTGVKTTGTSLAAVGDNFVSLSNAMLTRFQPKRDDIEQRDVYWEDNQEFEAHNKQLGYVGSSPASVNYPNGYNELDFCEDGTIATAYNTVQIAKNNSRWELWGDVTGAANQQLHIITEEVASIPLLQG